MMRNPWRKWEFDVYYNEVNAKVLFLTSSRDDDKIFHRVIIADDFNNAYGNYQLCKYFDTIELAREFIQSFVGKE